MTTLEKLEKLSKELQTDIDEKLVLIENNQNSEEWNINKANQNLEIIASAQEDVRIKKFLDNIIIEEKYQL